MTPPKFAFEDLAPGVDRQVVDDMDRLGHLERRQRGAAVGGELVDRELSAGPEDLGSALRVVQITEHHRRAAADQLAHLGVVVVRVDHPDLQVAAFQASITRGGNCPP